MKFDTSFYMILLKIFSNFNNYQTLYSNLKVTISNRDDSATRRSNSIKDNKQSNSSTSTTSNAGLHLDEHQQSLMQSLTTFKPVAISINTFFKQESDKLSDEDLFRCLNDLKKSTNLIKKLKCLPGCLKMEFSPFNYDLATNISHPYLSTLHNCYILSSELQEIKFHNRNIINIIVNL